MFLSLINRGHSARIQCCRSYWGGQSWTCQNRKQNRWLLLLPLQRGLPRRFWTCTASVSTHSTYLSAFLIGSLRAMTHFAIFPRFRVFSLCITLQRIFSESFCCCKHQEKKSFSDIFNIFCSSHATIYNKWSFGGFLRNFAMAWQKENRIVPH